MRYVVIDVEATGLDPTKDRIIEIAAVRMVDGQVDGEYSQLVNPGQEIPKIVTEITGISDEDVVDAPALTEVAAEYREFIGDDPVVGHNVPFDIDYLTRGGVDLEGVEWYDTLELAKLVLLKVNSYALQSLCASYGVTYDAHRALGDCQATGQLMELLIGELGRLDQGVRKVMALEFEIIKPEWAKLIREEAGSRAGEYQLTEVEAEGAVVAEDLEKIEEGLVEYYGDTVSLGLTLLAREEEAVYVTLDPLRADRGEYPVLYQIGSYLCPERLEQFEIETVEEAVFAAKMRHFDLITKTGLRSELSLQMGEFAMWDRVSAIDSKSSYYAAAKAKILEDARVVVELAEFVKNIADYERWPKRIYDNGEQLEERLFGLYEQSVGERQVADPMLWGLVNKWLAPEGVGGPYPEHMLIDDARRGGPDYFRLEQYLSGHELAEVEEILAVQEGWVNWGTAYPDGGARLVRTPLKLPEEVEQLWSKPMYLLGSNLQYQESFADLRERLQIPEEVGELVCPVIDSDQIEVTVVNGLPSVTTELYTERVGELIDRLLPSLERRTVIVAPNAGVLGELYFTVKEACDRQKIELIADGLAGGKARTREALVGLPERAVFLTTAVKLRKLKTSVEFHNLVLTKLPFPPPHPVNVARGMACSNEFMEVVLPAAVRAYRQAWVALLGVSGSRRIILTDGRLTSAQYGEEFLNSIPGSVAQRRVKVGEVTG